MAAEALPKTDPVTIARHGNLIWAAEYEDAGPYYLMHPSRFFWQLYARFGTGPEVRRPRSFAQTEAFEQSSAAFHVIRLWYEPFESYDQHNRKIAKAAATAARLVWKRKSMAEAVLRHGRAAEYEDDVRAEFPNQLRKLGIDPQE